MPGGWALGHLGPVPEGLVTWLLAAAACVGDLRRDRRQVEARVRPRLRTLFVALIVVVFGRRQADRHAGGTPPSGPERIVPEGAPSPGAELVVLALLGFSAVCAAGFIVVYAFDGVASPDAVPRPVARALASLRSPPL